MKKGLEIISYLSLILVIAAPVLYYMDRLTLEQNKFWMMVATLLWFVTASFWIGTKKGPENES
jgi:ABC-type iron transport system FetAB permease component